MVVKDDDILICRNGDGSLTLSYLFGDRFIEHTYMFYSLKESKKMFKAFVKDTIYRFI